MKFEKTFLFHKDIHLIYKYQHKFNFISHHTFNAIIRKRMSKLVIQPSFGAAGQTHMECEIFEKPKDKRKIYGSQPSKPYYHTFILSLIFRFFKCLPFRMSLAMFSVTWLYYQFTFNSLPFPSVPLPSLPLPTLWKIFSYAHKNNSSLLKQETYFSFWLQHV